MSECDEIALNIIQSMGLYYLFEEIRTRDDARRIVKDFIPDESMQVIDNIAESLFNSIVGQGRAVNG